MRKLLVLFLILTVIISSGCATESNENVHGTEGETTYEYYNETNQNVQNITNGTFGRIIQGGVSLGYVFKITFNEMVAKPGDSFTVQAVFNNIIEDHEPHLFLARMLPAEVDFDVKSAYKCQYFADCLDLQSDMAFWIFQNKSSVNVSYGFVGFRDIYFSIPEDAANGTYMFTTIACRDVEYDECDQSTSNFGPSQMFSVKII
jgi:hypothetical protein